jgi:U4/U6 small nuclear ribonucleoprotein PRP31
MDLTKVDLTALLSSAAVMVVTVTGSTTSGRSLSVAELATVAAACAEWRALAAARTALLAFIESRMGALAPNVTELLTSRVAAVLVAAAGGLGALARAPSCNVQVFGAKKRAGAGTIVRGAGAGAGAGTSAPPPHSGVLFDAPLLSGLPAELRARALRALAGKVVLAARMDAFRSGAGGAAGRGLRADLEAKFAKWREPPPARAPKPLPVPDEKKSKRRGGRLARARKEKFAVTDVRREANRVAVTADAAADYADTAMGADLGGLSTGATATGRLRVAERSGQLRRILGGGAKKRRADGGGAGAGVAGGTLSSFALTPVTGMELRNPEAPRAEAAGAGAYFANSGTFSAFPRDRV